MKVVVADTGALISLELTGHIGLIEEVFDEFYIAEAVWKELNAYDNPTFNKAILKELESRVVKITSKNHLSMVLDYGESESVILYEQINADFLLIDDQKARIIAESFDVNCIGTIGLLISAKSKGLIPALKPIFMVWIRSGRFFSKKLLNMVLSQEGENNIE